MRVCRILIVATLALLVATTASALITVTYRFPTQSYLEIGETFGVEVWLGYDGSPTGLTNIYTSTSWNPNLWSLVGTSGT
jgi:hypothetical protein